MMVFCIFSRIVYCMLRITHITHGDIIDLGLYNLPKPIDNGDIKDLSPWDLPTLITHGDIIDLSLCDLPIQHGFLCNAVCI